LEKDGAVYCLAQDDEQEPDYSGVGMYGGIPGGLLLKQK
jgi:hypothetical protein